MEALNSEIKQLLDTGTLRAVKLSDDPAGASVINSTMVSPTSRRLNCVPVETN